MISTLTMDDLEFEVSISLRRKTLGITVDRRGELVINAPEECPETAMEQFVREKQFWIYTKLAVKASLRAETSRRQFVSGGPSWADIYTRNDPRMAGKSARHTRAVHHYRWIARSNVPASNSSSSPGRT